MKFVSLLLSVFFFSASHSQHVLFGEKNPNASSQSVYFDQDGMLYPDIRISTNSLLNAKSSLLHWYSQNPSITDSLFASNGIKAAKKSDSNEYQLHFLFQLNDSLLAKKSRELDSLSKNEGLEFYIHGYRKSYLQNEKDVTSVTEFDYLTKSLDSSRTRKNLVVHVYWDGLYDCCYSMNSKHNKELFKLFKEADVNTNAISICFANLLFRSKNKDINIVAHSLGSKIALKSVLYPQLNSKNIKIALIAPALSADFFKKSVLETSSIKNRSWLIFYNEKDFVLRKKDNKVGWFGPGVYAYGPTTLGCNYKNEAEDLKKWMTNYNSTIQFDVIDKTKIGKCHSLRCYTKNQNLIEVSRFLENK